MSDLLVVLPSRRPHNVARLWEAMQQTCRGDTTLLVGVDDEDPNWESYATGLSAAPGSSASGPYYMVRPWPGSIVAWINILAVQHAGEFRFIGHIGDDVLPRTVGWDVRVMEALGKTPFAHANDLYPFRPPGSLCTHVFCRSEIVSALGYLGVPAFKSMFVDDAWTAWGHACGITFLEDVILEHMHFSAGKAPVDEYYLRSAGEMGQGQQIFAAYCRNGLASDIAKIKAAT